MKDIILLVITGFSQVLSGRPCCHMDTPILERKVSNIWLSDNYSCGQTKDPIDIDCPNGAYTLRDILPKGDTRSKLESTLEIIFADDPYNYCIGPMYDTFKKKCLGTEIIAVICS